MYQKGDNKLRVLSLYVGGYAKQYYLREISRLAGLALRTAQSAIALLEAQGILVGYLHGKNKYFALNFPNPHTPLLLAQAEIEQTRSLLSTYPLLGSFFKELRTEDCVVVFGSFASGTATKGSDIDLLVISDQSGELPGHLLPYRIHRVDLRKDDWRKGLDLREPLLKEVQENHVILCNHSWFVREMWRHYAPAELGEHTVHGVRQMRRPS